MSSNTDFSQYLRKPSSPQKKAEENPFSQYMRKPLEAQQPQTQEQPVEDNRNVFERAIDKTGRLATQGAIGAIQSKTLAYDLPVIAAQTLARNPMIDSVRQSESENPELTEKVAGQQSKVGKGLEGMFRRGLEEQDVLRKESKLSNFVQNQGLDVGSLIERGAKEFGVDLSPKGADEMALRWMGFIKDPTKAQSLMKNGFNLQNIKEIGKALLPTAKEAVRGVGAGAALTYAAENEFGPIGTMLMAVLGDRALSLALKAGTAAVEFGKNPVKNTKELAAKGVAKFTPKDAVELQKAIIQDFKDAGIQPDLGTVSGNNIVKWVQTTLANSGLTGEPLEQFKKSLTSNIVSEYKVLANELGESIFQSKYEAGNAAKQGLTEARNLDLATSRDLYNSATERAATNQVFGGNIGKTILDIEEKLTPGSFKSAEQKAVLDILNQVKKDVLTPEGGIKGVDIKSLINNKLALNDAVEYEVQGGTKKLLQGVIKEIDKAIESHGKTDPQFAREWKMANAKFAEHAKIFRGKVINDALKTQDPSAIFSKMDSPHGVLEIKKALSKTPEGRQLFSQLARYKLEEMIGQNLVDSTTQQLNFGKFSKVLEKGQNRQIVANLLGKEALQKLEKLQKASGRLADTAQKFLNTSKTGYQISDLALAGKVLTDFGNVFLFGNPWPLVKSGGTFLAAKTIAKYMADPEFIQLVEDVLLESGKGSEATLNNAGIKLAQKIKQLEEPAKAAVQISPK